MQYYAQACFYRVSISSKSVSCLFAQWSVLAFKTHIMNMMYFSLSSSFSLKMYPSEDVALELSEW